jgi:hypothetical protein
MQQGENPMSLAQQFREFVGDDAEELYFKELSGCVPDDFIGDDLMESIISRAYKPFKFVVEEVLKSNYRIWIAVEPSYEDATRIIAYTDDIVLEDWWCKMWQFWFTDDADFEKWVNERLDIWKAKIEKYKAFLQEDEYTKKYRDLDRFRAVYDHGAGSICQGNSRRKNNEETETA